MKLTLLSRFVVIVLFGCAVDGSKPSNLNFQEALSQGENLVSDQVTVAHNRTTSNLNLADQRDFENAQKGFISTLKAAQIVRANGQSAYDLAAYDFLQDEAPTTVNPSLWRQSKLLAKNGLFEVTPGIYQVRGFDLSNITFIKGDTGWIVVDPLVSAETARAAKMLVDRELGKLPVSAMIITHSHADHFGGIRGIVSEADVANGLDIIAPAGFLYESINENILAGNAMSRRVSYMFGGLLPKDAKHQVGVGLGQGVSSGSLGLIAPTVEINKSGERRMVDGIEIEFILALGSEATSEFMFYLPQYKAFCQAEVINHTFHNMYTPRGAKVRDGRLWSSYIDEAIYTYGDKAEVSFGSHHWPVWGQQDIIDLWSGQRDLYRYVHDQTLRLANQGYTLHEIPDRIQLPGGIANNFANRGYYGTVSHNAKSQYQLYFGYFDGNPANLDPLPPVEHAAKFVAYAGGASALLQKAKADYDNGEFRFAATALNHLVFAQPENRNARELLAQTYTQLAYIAESGSWRNFYLTGAQELRNGIRVSPVARANSPDIVSAIPLNLYFDFLAVRLNGPAAAKQDMELNFRITDTGEHAHLIVSNGALHHRMGQTSESATTLAFTRAGLNALNLKQKSLETLVNEGTASVDGDAALVRQFFSLIEEPDFWFEIIAP